MPKRQALPAGCVSVVSTPIGNSEDLAPRAARALREADLVAAEDTRTARRLLRALGVAKPLVSYHDWNEAERVDSLLARVAEGRRIALVSEAGTPGLSDPGYDLVRAARQRGLPVVPVPGPSALTAFLSVCGLPTNAFSFFGFPPSRPAARRALFAGLAPRAETLVFFESPRRIVSALADARGAFGDRECCLGREMTKPHEEFLFGDLSRVEAALRERPKVLGEICWGLRGATEASPKPQTVPFDEAAREALGRGMPLKEAARDLAIRFSLTTRQAYAALVAAKSDERPG